MATRTRSLSQTHMISRRYLHDTRQSLTRFAGPPKCRLTEIIKLNDPRANYSRITEAKYAEIRDLVNRGTFGTVLKTELPYGANLITARHVISIKSDEDKEERYKARYVFGGHLDIMKYYLVHGANYSMRISSHNPSCCENQRFPYMAS